MESSHRLERSCRFADEIIIFRAVKNKTWILSCVSLLHIMTVSNNSRGLGQHDQIKDVRVESPATTAYIVPIL